MDGIVVPFADRDLDLAAPHIMSVVVQRDVELATKRIELGLSR